MSGILIRCPGCGKQSQAAASFEPVVCVHCGKSFLLPRKLVMEATNTTAEERQQTETKTKLNEGFFLLETPIDNPEYNEKTRQALGIFTQIIKDDKSVSRAWFGLFACLLNQCRKTFEEKEKIPGTEYWFFATPVDKSFVAESYFYRVTVNKDGSVHPILYDNTLQPGRKAHYYLHNAIESASDESDKAALQKQMELYFTNAPQEMARTGAAHLSALPK